MQVRELAEKGPEGEIGTGAVPPGYVFDPSSGYFHNPESGLYYDASSGGYFSSSTNKWYSFDQTSQQYVEWPAS